MKFCIALLLSLSLNGLLYGQSHIQWTRIEATPNSQINSFMHMGTDDLGNTYFIDFTQSAITYFVTYRFFCYGTNGAKKWQYDNDSCFTDCSDRYQLVVPLPGGAGAIFIGAYDGISPGSYSIRIKRIDGYGNLVWQNNWIGAMLGGEASTALIDNGGRLVLGLHGAVNATDGDDFAVAVFDTATGVNIWHTEIPDGGSGTPLSELITSLCADNAGNVYGCGVAGADRVFFKISTAGVLQYRLPCLASGLGSSVSKIIADNTGSLYILEQPSGTAVSSVRIEKRDAFAGALDWASDIDHDTAEIQPVGMVLNDGDVYALANYRYFFPDTTFSGGEWGPMNYLLAKLNESGTAVWQKDCLKGASTQLGMCNDKLYVVSSKTRDSANVDLVLHKIDTAGNTVWYDSTLMDSGTGMFDFDDACNVFISRSAELGQDYVWNYTQKFSDEFSWVCDIRLDAALKVWPVPAKDRLMVELPVQEPVMAHVQVTDVAGRSILTTNVTQGAFEVPVISLLPGTYLLSVSIPGQKTLNHTIVKQ